MDLRLSEALRVGSPADISAAYKDLADFHFEQRNMAVADELYAFSALHEAAGLTHDLDGHVLADGHSVRHHHNDTPGTSQTGALPPSDQDECSASCAMNVSPRSQHLTPRGENPCTTLSVTVLEAQRLSSLPATSGASRSLFCTVSLECPGKTSITTRTELVPHSDSPKWNARFEFRIDDVAVHQGVVNVAVMERRIFSSSMEGGDHSNKLELAVSRIGVVRSIRLHQIYSGNGTLQRWFTVAPAPEQEVGSARALSPTSKSCCLALMLQTSDAKVYLASRTSTPAVLSPTHSRSPASTPLLSPRPASSNQIEDGLDDSVLSGAQGSDGDPSVACLEWQQPRLRSASHTDPALLKKSLISDMALLKRALERKPEGKVWFESPAVVALTLAEKFDEVSASQEARRRFQDELADNVASALCLARRQILVFGLRRGSVIATIGILVPGGGPSAAELAAELQRQIEVPLLPYRARTCLLSVWLLGTWIKLSSPCGGGGFTVQDPQSVMKQGRITRKATKVVQLDRTDAGSPASGKHESELSGSPIVMASPRPRVVFEGGMDLSPRTADEASTHAHPHGTSAHKAAEPGAGAPVDELAVAQGEAAQEQAVWTDQDGAHNPKAVLAFAQQDAAAAAAAAAHRRAPLPSPVKSSVIRPDDELGSILSARKKQVAARPLWRLAACALPRCLPSVRAQALPLGVVALTSLRCARGRPFGMYPGGPARRWTSRLVRGGPRSMCRAPCPPPRKYSALM
jgi:hypothetical protein